MALREGDLDAAFAQAVVTSTPFRNWLLEQTGFHDRAPTARLLHEEQGADRPVWWKHWWCRIPDLGEERETDIFLVFEADDGRGRFALHVENKKGDGKFLPGQPEGYAPRAAFMADKERYMSYSEFQTVLIAPRSFQEANRGKCALFDVLIAYEDIAKFIPEFGT